MWTQPATATARRLEATADGRAERVKSCILVRGSRNFYLGAGRLSSRKLEIFRPPLDAPVDPAQAPARDHRATANLQFLPLDARG